MTTIEEIQHAIRQLSRVDREGLAEWILNCADFSRGVRERPAAYAGVASDHRMPLEEFLRMDTDSVRYEYIAGQVFAMAPPTLRHEIIVSNLSGAFHAHVGEGPCKVFGSNTGVRLRVNNDDIIYLPDVIVDCGPFDLNAEDTQCAATPRLIVEVLSPATERYDRGEKALNYRHLDSLEEYVLIAQKWRQVTFLRRSDGWAGEVLTSPGEVARFCSIGLNMTLERIYQGG